MLENLKIRNTTICDCGRQFIIQDIEKLERINDPKFYQGVVKHFSKAKCPKCGKEVILLLKQAGQTYEVVSIAENVTNNAKSGNKNVNELAINGTENVETVQNNAKIENTEIENVTNDFICSECGRKFKNKSGLTNHMKTHNN